MEFVIFDEIKPPLATDLKAAVDSNPDKLVVRMHSPGGSVVEGIAALGVLQDSKVPLEVRIDGLAASMASAIAATAPRVVAHPQALLMIHRASSIALGNAEDLAKEAELLGKVDQMLASVYAAKSGKPVAEILDLMTAETWFTAQEAKDFGLVDEVLQGGNLVPQPQNAATRFALVAKFKHPPESVIMKDESKTQDSAPETADGKLEADGAATANVIIEASTNLKAQLEATSAKLVETTALLVTKDAEILALTTSLAETTQKLNEVLAGAEADKRVRVLNKAKQDRKWLPIFDSLFASLSSDALEKLVNELPALVPAESPRPASTGLKAYRDMSETERLVLLNEQPELFKELHAEFLQSQGY